MPAVERYWSFGANTDEYTRKLMDTARQELDGRAKAIGKAWNYFYGGHPKPLKVYHGEPDNNVILNLFKQHARSTVSFAAWEFPTIDLEQGQASDNERVIKDFWKRVGGAVWLQTTMLQGLMAGHVFCRLIPPLEGNPARLITLNPTNVQAFWSEDDFEDVLWVSLYYSKAGRKRRLDMIAPDVDNNPSWQLREYQIRGNSWELLDPVINWGYQHPPIYHVQHLPKPMHFYGEDELEGLPLNDAINKVASDMSATIRNYAAPTTIMVGATLEEDNGVPGQKVTRVPSGAMISGLPSDAKVSLLEMRGDMSASMNYLGLLRQTYMNLMQVTLLDGTPDQYKGITNLGIKAAFMNQLAKTETLQNQYGKLIAQLTQGAGELLGLTLPEPMIQWPNALPESRAELVQTAVQEVQAGFASRTTVQAELGRNPEQELQRMIDESVTNDLTAGVPLGVSG